MPRWWRSNGDKGRQNWTIWANDMGKHSAVKHRIDNPMNSGSAKYYGMEWENGDTIKTGDTKYMQGLINDIVESGVRKDKGTIEFLNRIQNIIQLNGGGSKYE